MASNELGTNKAMKAGDSIKSPDANTILTMQSDGNLVLSMNGKPLWTSGTAGNPVDNLWMNWDGNLRITSPDNKILWSNGASGHKDAFLRVNNGGTFYVWDGSNHQIWDSGTTGGKVNPTPGGHGVAHTDFGGFDKFLKEAANTCGDVLKIVGPIVAVVVNIIPGIGQAASAAIFAGLAVATATVAAAKAVLNNDPKALIGVISAAAGAMGGSDPEVAAAIQAGAGAVSSAVNGQPIANIISNALQAVPNLPPDIKQGISTVGNLIAAGNSIESPQVKSVISNLPQNIQSGLKLGALTGNSAVVNSSSTITPAVINSLQHMGLVYENSNPIAAHARTLVGQGTLGFDVGLGCTFNKISANNLNTIREGLSSIDQNGFDSALALHIGSYVSPTPNANVHPMQSAGHLMTVGMKSAPESNRVAMMQNIANNPTARAGAVIAVKQLANEKQGFFTQFIHWIEGLFTGN